MFDPTTDDARDYAYGLMGGALAEGPKTGSIYEQVMIGERERDGSCVVQVGRLALRVVDWWEAEPLVVENIR